MNDPEKFSRPNRDPVYKQRFSTALDLMEFAEATMRHKIRKQDPEATSEEVESRVLDWYLASPLHIYEGARRGDRTRFE